MAESRMPGKAEAGRASGAASRHTAPWVEKLARFGYAAKGAVYILIGGLAVAAALGSGGQTSGSAGAMASISGSTAGQIVLGLIAVGLVGYVIWGLVRAVSNPENDSGGARAYYVLSALIHGGLAVEAGRLALGGGSSGSGGSGSGAAHWSATLMQQPFGVWLLGLVGAGLVIFGLQQVWHAWRVDLDDRLALGSMSSTVRTWAVRSGRFGLAARGVVLAIIGGYVVVAAVQADPSEARGVDGVLDMLRQTPWLLAVVALGLVAYGIYNFVRARFRVIRPA